MSRVTFAIRPPGTYDVLRLALSAANLPHHDIDLVGRTFFELSDDQGPIGFIGLEGVGADRLLRSLVVLPSRKRQGHGGLLVAHIEVAARRDGVERLHLLTVTVANFFRVRGYRDAERADAPGPIRATAQFSLLCPDSATYLVKDLT